MTKCDKKVDETKIRGDTSADKTLIYLWCGHIRPDSDCSVTMLIILIEMCRRCRECEGIRVLLFVRGQ